MPVVMIGNLDRDRNLSASPCSGNSFCMFYCICYLRSHDELVVDDVVGSEAHPEQCTGRVKVARHPRPAVYVLSESLKQQMRTVHTHSWASLTGKCSYFAGVCTRGPET